MFYIIVQVKQKIPITGCGGLRGHEILRIPHCLDSQLTDASEVVSLMPAMLYWYSFLLEAKPTPGPYFGLKD
jgi:hypothetical protein